VAKNIGDQNIKIDKTRPSINAISEKYLNATKSYQLIFKPIDESFVSKRISNINVKKATGVDNISLKRLHYAKPVIAKPMVIVLCYFSRLIENCPCGSNS
jgi:hypothetical protein